MDKPQKKLLMGLIENPYEVITAGNKPDLIQILESVRKGVQSNAISVKDTAKAVTQIDEILTDEMKDSFQSLFQHYLTIVLNDEIN